jgi:integrase
VTVFMRPNGKLGVHVYDPTAKGNKAWVGTFETEDEARAAEARAIAARGSPRRKETCDSFALRHPLDYPREARSSNRTQAYALRRFIRDFKGVPLDGVTRTRARQWALAQPVSTTDAVRKMYNDALSDGLVKENPFANLRRPRSRGRRDLTVIKEPAIYELAACAEKAWGEFGRLVFGPMIVFFSFVLCRLAELYFIARDDILWTEEELLLIDADDGAGDPKAPKNWNPRRVILPPQAAQAAKIVPPRIDVPWLFYTKTGKQFNKGSLFYYWNPVRTLFGRPGMDFYELKHAGTSYYVNELDLDEEDIAFQIGHMDGGKLIRTLYGHREERRARARMKEAFRERTQRRYEL